MDRMKLRQTFHIVSLPVVLSGLVVAALMFWSFSLGQLFDAELLDAEERAWLDEHRGEIVLGYDPGAEPVEFRDANGKFSGIVADYVELLEEKLGVEFATTEVQTWPEVLELAESGEIDVLPAVEITAERAKYLSFTQSYLSSPRVILVRTDAAGTAKLEDLDDLKGRRVAVVRGYALLSELRRAHPEIELVPIDDPAAGLVDVALGRMDAMVTAMATAGYLIESLGLTNLRVIPSSEGRIELRIASRKDAPLLHSALEKGLNSITRAERVEILQRWVPLPRPAPFSSWQFWLTSAAGIVIFSLALGAVLAWNRALNRLMLQRTDELEREGVARRRAEAALDDREQSMTSTLDSIRDAIVVTDVQGRIARMNGAAEALAGCDTARAFGKPMREIFKLVDPESREIIASGLENVLESPDAVGFGADALLLINGSEYRVSETCVPILSRGGEMLGAVAALRDVTEDHALRDQLRDAHRLEAVGQLAGGIAHDFNNLLAAIMGNAELIQFDGQESDANRIAVEEIAKASQRAANLTRQLLAFTRQGHEALAVVDVHDSIESVLGPFASGLDARVNLVRDLDAKRPFVRCDRVQLQVALRVLCGNAREAMPVGGILKVSTREVVLSREQLLRHADLAPAPHVEIRVSDTGVGMAPEVQTHLFEPFFSTKRSIHSTGMGLASAYGSIRSYGGAIEVASRVGEGSTFTILLPLAEAPEAPPPSPEAVDGRVLIVDDDDGVRTLASRVLSTLGYEVATCSDGVQAVEFFGKHHRDIALVLLDLAMPRLGGDNVFARLCEIDPTVPVVIVSGYVQSPKAHAMLEHGARGVLWKPFHIDDLARTVHEHVRPSSV